MVCAELGVEGALQHHEYVACWLRRITDDPQALFTAASKAQAAATYILTGGEAGRVENNQGSEMAEPQAMAA